MNVGLNLVLIPPLGGVGAAIATLVSYAVASFGACFLYAPVRGQAWAMVRALLLPVRLVVGRVRGRHVAPRPERLTRASCPDAAPARGARAVRDDGTFGIASWPHRPMVSHRGHVQDVHMHNRARSVAMSLLLLLVAASPR